MFWYEDEVKRVEYYRDSNTVKSPTVFYGSSTIRLWNSLSEDFKNIRPLNLGFGGATLASCVWFYDRIIAPLKHPKHFIIYAGDNDLGDVRHPEEVIIFFEDFMEKLRHQFKNVPCGFI